jgi:hypothetical protein
MTPNATQTGHNSHPSANYHFRQIAAAHAVMNCLKCGSITAGWLNSGT